MAVGKVFEVDPTRIDEFDFHNADLTQDIEVEVTVGDLSSILEQRFLDRLEFWDPVAAALIEGVDDPAELPEEAMPVVRLSYRAGWNHEEERADQTVYWTKTSDPSTDDLRRIARDDRAAFPYLRLTTMRPLSLAARGLLRSSLATTDADAIADALGEITEGMNELAARISRVQSVTDALEGILASLRQYAGMDTEIADMVRFVPEDGSLSGLLRALSPAIDLGDEVGRLPLARHGSTTAAQVVTAELIGAASQSDAVVAVDDFGDGLDSASAQRLASLLRNKAGQVWLSTRRSEAARSFDVAELIRLTRSGNPAVREVHYGKAPETRGERVATRELHRQILPAMTARALLIGEGPHDSSSYAALAERLDLQQNVAPPEAYGIRIVDAGSTDGGIDKVAHVAELARHLGFRVVALTDYDHDEADAASRLAACQAAADAVIRLPRGDAIESALLEGVPDAEIIAALLELTQTYQLPLPAGWQSLTGAALVESASKALKSNNGLHGPFIRALPGTLPPVACQALSSAIECARGTRADALVQL